MVPVRQSLAEDTVLPLGDRKDISMWTYLSFRTLNMAVTNNIIFRWHIKFLDVRNKQYSRDYKVRYLHYSYVETFVIFQWYLLPYHRPRDLQSPLQWVRYSNSCCPQSSGAVSSSLSRRNQFLNNNRRLYSRVSRKEGVSPLFVYTAIHAQGCFHSYYCSLTASGIGLPQKIYILRKFEAHFTLISCVCWFDKFHMVVLLYFPPFYPCVCSSS